MKLYYNKVTATAWSATSAQSGYPASNVSLESITRNWRGNDATALDVVITFAAATTVAALLLTDVNFASCAILKSPDGSSFSSVGTLTTFADKLTGRRRGLIEINDANVKAIKISISSGTPSDGLAYWRIGSAYPFANSVALPRNPDYHVRVAAIYPKLRAELPNKQVAVASTGPDILTLTMPFTRASGEDPLEIVRRGRAGTVGLSISNTNYPELVLPVRHVEEGQDEVLDFYAHSSLDMELREVV